MESKSQPYSAPEVADHRVDLYLLLNIMDFLHDDPKTLGTCCLLRKEWLPYVRKYLFPHVNLKKIEQFRRLKEYFPDPLGSPLNHTRSLAIERECAASLTKEETVFIRRSFTGLKRLDVWFNMGKYDLVPFHCLSSTVKFLRVSWKGRTPGEILNFICSFPHLKSLRVASSGDPMLDEIWEVPQSLQFPEFTGTLTLHDEGTFPLFILSSESPKSFRFRKIVQENGNNNSFNPIDFLVERCASTLECIDLDRRTSIEPCKFDPSDLSDFGLQQVQLTCRARQYSNKWNFGSMITTTPKLLGEYSTQSRPAINVWSGFRSIFQSIIL